LLINSPLKLLCGEIEAKAIHNIHNNSEENDNTHGINPILIIFSIIRFILLGDVGKG
jgi:hypothetical protein